MKKFVYSVAVLAASLWLSGCGTTGSALSGMGASSGAGASASSGSSSATSGLSSLIGSVLGTLLGGSNQLTEADLVGTWAYQGSDCVFESENFLMKAGGEVAAAKIETKVNEAMGKVGIAPGRCSFVFNEDKTYALNVGSRTVMSGQYALDAENKKLTMTYLAGLGTMTPNVVKNGGTISILYEADKMLAIAQKLAALSGNSSLQTLSSLASSYDGMMIGLELKK